MGRATPWCLLACAGCAQIAGIETTSGSDNGVSLTFERVSIGTTLVRSPLDLTGRSATYLVPDEAAPGGFTRVAAMQSAVNTWTAELDDVAPVVFDLPDVPNPQPRIWDLPYRDLTGIYAVLEHPNPQPAPANATLSVNVTLDAAYSSETLVLYTIGSWNRGNLPAPAAGAMTLDVSAFPFTQLQSISGRPHDKIAPEDAVLVLRYAGTQLAGAYEGPGFDQVDTNAITGTLAPVALDQRIDATIDQNAIAMRFSAARPAVSAPQLAWGVTAAPGAEIGANIGPQLHAGAVGMMDPPTISAMYGNPFATKWPSVLLWYATASRTYTPPSAMLPVTLAAEMYQLVQPGTGLTLDLPAGFPELVTIDGRPLSTDGTTLPLPTAPVEITFVTDRPDNTIYTVSLLQLVPNTAMPPTALERKYVIGVMATEPRVVIPPEYFSPNALYTLLVSAQKGGIPMLESGDLLTRSLPVAEASFHSGVFQVTP